MARSTDPPRNLKVVIDRIEQIREELTGIQTSLEKMEAPKGPIKKKVALG
jgi:hypothetical protein